MKFTLQREAFLTPLQKIAGAVEKRQTLPILSNVLIQVNSHQLSVTATDTEVELIGRITLTEPAEVGKITVPAKKLIDICKALPDEANLTVTLDGKQVLIKSGRSRFSLTTLPAEEFPNLEEGPGDFEFNSPLKQVSDEHI